MNNIFSLLLQILNEGDRNKIAAADEDLKNWRSPGTAYDVSRVMSSAKDFVTEFWR